MRCEPANAQHNGGMASVRKARKPRPDYKGIAALLVAAAELTGSLLSTAPFEIFGFDFVTFFWHRARTG